jgi:hypothetical protein
MRNRFWSVVPRPMRIAACAVLSCVLLIGMVAGLVHGIADGRATAHAGPLPFVETGAGLGLGIFLGAMIAFWLSALGFVYADARRRGMPPVLWVLVALLVPNLLGFLLYFALRRPLATACAQCGNAVMAEQRFCAWCGSAATPPPTGGAPFPTDSGLGPTAAV